MRLENQPQTFPPRQRIRTRREFDAIFVRKQRAFEGPLGMYAAENSLPYCRMGIVMSRRVGTAVRRNRIKRMLRESFRLCQHSLPPGFDLLVVPRPHEPLSLEDYKTLFTALARKVITRGGQT
jgi:ribonuclease P protein component